MIEELRQPGSERTDTRQAVQLAGLWGRSTGWRHLEDDVEARAGWDIGVVDIAKTPANSQGALAWYGQRSHM